MVATDLVQFALMMVGTLLYALWVTMELGGLGSLVEQLYERFASAGPGGITASQILAFEPSQAKDASMVVLSVLALQWLVQMNADGTGYLAQRVMACRSDRDAKIAAVVFAFAQVLLRSLVWLPIGLGLLLLFEPNPALGPAAMKADREATFARRCGAGRPGAARRGRRSRR